MSSLPHSLARLATFNPRDTHNDMQLLCGHHAAVKVRSSLHRSTRAALPLPRYRSVVVGGRPRGVCTYFEVTMSRLFPGRTGAQEEAAAAAAAREWRERMRRAEARRRRTQHRMQSQSLGARSVGTGGADVGGGAAGVNTSSWQRRQSVQGSMRLTGGGNGDGDGGGDVGGGVGSSRGCEGTRGAWTTAAAVTVAEHEAAGAEGFDWSDEDECECGSACGSECDSACECDYCFHVHSDEEDDGLGVGGSEALPGALSPPPRGNGDGAGAGAGAGAGVASTEGAALAATELGGVVSRVVRDHGSAVSSTAAPSPPPAPSPPSPPPHAAAPMFGACIGVSTQDLPLDAMVGSAMLSAGLHASGHVVVNGEWRPCPAGEVRYGDTVGVLARWEQKPATPAPSNGVGSGTHTPLMRLTLTFSVNGRMVGSTQLDMPPTAELYPTVTLVTPLDRAMGHFNTNDVLYHQTAVGPAPTNGAETETAVCVGHPTTHPTTHHRQQQVLVLAVDGSLIAAP